MKTSIRIAAVFAAVSLVVGISALFSQAQVPGPGGAPAASRPPAASAVAVIDINHIFKNHTRFKRMMEDMKRDVEASEAELRDKRDAINKLIEQLRMYKPGTPEYNRLEETITKEQVALKADMEIKRRDFMDREAKIYYRVYDEITREVTHFAQRHGIALVLRYSMDEIDPDNRASVLQGVNRPVIYQQSVNITYDILDRLERVGPATPVSDPRTTVPPRF